MGTTTCGTQDCDRPVFAKGLCSTHYQRQRRGSDLATPIRAVGEGKEWPNVIFRAPQELKSDAEEAARQQDIDVSEWWRRAGQAALRKSARSAGRRTR